MILKFDSRISRDQQALQNGGFNLKVEATGGIGVFVFNFYYL